MHCEEEGNQRNAISKGVRVRVKRRVNQNPAGLHDKFCLRCAYRRTHPRSCTAEQEEETREKITKRVRVRVKLFGASDRKDCVRNRKGHQDAFVDGFLVQDRAKALKYATRYHVGLTLKYDQLLLFYELNKSPEREYRLIMLETCAVCIRDGSSPARACRWIPREESSGVARRCDDMSCEL